MTVLWVALGGAIGSAARYQVNVWSGRLIGAEFPWHTLIVNIAGCFIMGALVELMALRLNIGNEVRAFLTTGILGGFTTFSAFGLETFSLARDGRWTMAAANLLLQTVGGLLAVWAGYRIAT